MTSAVLTPVRVHARPDPTLNRWLWLVKWLLVLPHLVLLALLWPAFAVLSVIALVAIAITGRYPQPLFDFNVGVLRWTWRVAYYAYGALATDRYPPFSLGEHPEYPATLDIPYPPRLSRGLVLVKWLLALPHLLIVAVFIGAGTYLVSQTGQWALNLGGLIGLLTLAAGVALLFTGRYPQGLFDFILGLDRWVLRVAAYVGLMTDTYPPFRLDLGGPDPAAAAIVPTPPRTARPPAPWGAGRITAAVVGSLLILAGLGTAGGGITLGIIDQTRTDTGLISTSPVTIDIDAAAAQLGPVDLTWTGPAEWTAASALGQVQVTGRAANTDTALFIGIGPAAAVADYLAGVRTAQLTPLGAVITATDGPADTPANPPAAHRLLVGRQQRNGRPDADLVQRARQLDVGDHERRRLRRRAGHRHPGRGRAGVGVAGARAAHHRRSARTVRGRPRDCRHHDPPPPRPHSARPIPPTP